MLVTTENLAEMLEVNPNTIGSWELSLGLNIKTNDLDVKNYSEDLINLFKNVKSFILNGYTLASIRDFLSAEIQYQNQLQQSINSILVEDDGPQCADKIADTVSLVNDYIFGSTNADEKINVLSENIINETLDRPETTVFFKSLLKELKQYSERASEAEKKVYLLEASENKVRQEHLALSADVKELRSELEVKNQKIREFEEQKKRLNLMEVQMKLLQLENSRKKFWDYWK